MRSLGRGSCGHQKEAEFAAVHRCEAQLNCCRKEQVAEDGHRRESESPLSGIQRQITYRRGECAQKQIGDPRTWKPVLQ